MFGAAFPGGGITGGFASSGAVNAAQASSASISNLSFGAAEPNRYVVAVIGCQLGLGASAGSLTGITIGGVAATIVVSQSAPVSAGVTDVTVIAIAAVAMGSSGIVAASGSLIGAFGVALYALYGLASATPQTTNVSTSNPAAMTLSALPSGSFVVGGSMVHGTVNSWTGATQDVSQGFSGGSAAFYNQATASQSNTAAGDFSLSSSMSVSLGLAASAAAAWHP